jgi:hypothetical protein
MQFNAGGTPQAGMCGGIFSPPAEALVLWACKFEECKTYSCASRSVAGKRLVWNKRILVRVQQKL